MNRKLIASVTCFALAGLCFAQQTPVSREVQGKGKVPKIMQEKLKNSQKLLEGIALADYAKITSNAEALAELTTSEDWHVIKTPKYEMFSNEFKRTAENIIAKAKLKNIDG